MRVLGNGFAYTEALLALSYRLDVFCPGPEHMQ